MNSIHRSCPFLTPDVVILLIVAVSRCHYHRCCKCPLFVDLVVVVVISDITFVMVNAFSIIIKL